MITTDFLRKMAELNLCNDCFEKYNALIEPSVKKLLSSPLHDWGEIELQVTMMAMKSKGIFKDKTRMVFPDKGQEEQYSKEIDVKTYKMVKR